MFSFCLIYYIFFLSLNSRWNKKRGKCRSTDQGNHSVGTGVLSLLFGFFFFPVLSSKKQWFLKLGFSNIILFTYTSRDDLSFSFLFWTALSLNFPQITYIASQVFPISRQRLFKYILQAYSAVEKKYIPDLFSIIFQTVLGEITDFLTYKTVSLKENMNFCGIIEVMLQAGRRIAAF